MTANSFIYIWPEGGSIAICLTMRRNWDSGPCALPAAQSLVVSLGVWEVVLNEEQETEKRATGDTTKTENKAAVTDRWARRGKLERSN